jgi:EAL domain-containing protein (putative c-di-GMP-specific phosphodiesterase class I)
MRTQAFTKAILDLAASLDLDTIAEGVETEEQSALLQQMGCRLAQGYHFARPAPQIPLELLGPRPALNGVTPAMGDGGQGLRSAQPLPMD